MSIVMARLDNRLLHGVVAVQWAPQSGANRIMVIDDKTANDPILKESMRLGRPPGMATSVITLETALTNFKNHKYDNQKVFVVCNDPIIILKLQEIGESIATLILGGTINLSEEGTRVSNRAYVAKSQEAIYQKILDNGTSILVKFVPADKDVELSEVIKLSRGGV